MTYALILRWKNTSKIERLIFFSSREEAYDFKEWANPLDGDLVINSVQRY